MTEFSVMVKRVSPQQLFMLSALVVNGGNYLYNLILGRMLGPEIFADAALLVTLLLVLSFMGMTFQLVMAKFIAVLPSHQWNLFGNKITGFAILVGCVLGTIVFLAAPFLQGLLYTENAFMFRIFGIGVPFYFVMSVNRGQFQGEESFGKLSISYQLEMWGRLGITLLAFILINDHFGTLVAFGILASFILGLFPYKSIRFVAPKTTTLNLEWDKVGRFMLITASYELTQIIINNSDIVLVKHFFQAKEAGLYASLALIGRAVYFVAWMFVMVLLPNVVRLKKEGRPTKFVLIDYVRYVGLLSIVIVVGCAIFPEQIIILLFGKAYVPMSPLLWQYALSSSMFSLASMFTYYFLSLDHYKPILFSAIAGIIQITLITFLHANLLIVVQTQILVMAALLIFQFLYFFSKER